MPRFKPISLAAARSADPCWYCFADGKAAAVGRTCTLKDRSMLMPAMTSLLSITSLTETTIKSGVVTARVRSSGGQDGCRRAGLVLLIFQCSVVRGLDGGTRPRIRLPERRRWRRPRGRGDEPVSADRSATHLENRAGEAVLRGDHRPVIGAYANACGVVHSSGYPSTDSNSSR